jgi:prepilin-type processing-associated H-X9-DG protein
MLRSYQVGRGGVVILLAAGLVQAAAAAGSAVEGVAKRLPDNVIGFMATSGGDALKDDFGKTAPGKIWNDQGVQSFYRAIKTELLDQIKQESRDPNIAEQVNLVLHCVQLALSRPLVVGVAQVDVKEGPPVCAFAIVNAGPRKTEFTAALGKIAATMDEDDIVDIEVGSLKMSRFRTQESLYWGWVEDYLVIAVNDAQGTVARCVASPKTTMGPVFGSVPGSNDGLVAYCNYTRAGALIALTVQKEDGVKEASRVTAFASSLGFTAIRAMVARVGFVGPDVVGDGLLEMVMPPTGMFAACKPVDPSWLAAVDARAMAVTAVNVDVAALYDLFMNTVKMVSPDEGYPEIRKGIAGFETTAKVQIRKGLLDSLAGPIVFYTLPAGTMAEAPRGGFVTIAGLKETRHFEKAVTALGDFTGSKSNGMLQISSQTRDDGRIVHVWAVAPLALMGLMPSWSLANDHVVIGSNTQLCDMGVKQLVAKGPDTKSLLDTDGYKKVAAGLPKGLVSLAYTDSRVQLDQTMMQLQQVWPMLTMAAMQKGIKLPVMLPSVTEISRDLGPSCEYWYLSPEGLRWHYRGSGIEPSQVSVGGVAMGMGILMPAMARVRQLSFRMTSGTNLSSIGKACLIYANDHDDKLPPDLQSLVDNAELPSKCLESKRKPSNFDGPSYIYIPGQTTEMYPGNIVAYENPAFCEDGVNVLFLDSHVEFMKPQDFRRELGETCGRLGRPVPDVKFKGEMKGKPPAPKPVTPSHVRESHPVPSDAQDACVAMTQAFQL